MTDASMKTDRRPKAERQIGNRSLRTLLSDKRFYEYRRLAALVALVNLGILVHAIGGWWAGVPDLGALLNVVIVNFTLAILIRQQYIVNALFWLATRAPTYWPLRVRWALGKVYHFGGLHSGGSVAGTLWFLGYLGTAFLMGGPGVSSTTLALAGALSLLLVGMIVLALGPVRARFHDAFERSHRFMGWAVLALFWLHMFSLHDDLNADTSILTTLGFWLLTAITISIALPWLRLKRVPIEVVRPSSHVALVQFDYGDTPFAGSSNAISVNPLIEWHSFANIPTPGENGYRLAISRSGDWTGAFIDNPPDHVWVKGITTSGVARIELLFKRVVYIATGSGIGPVLPHLLAQDVPSHLIWATRSPRKTYGDSLVDEIITASPDAIIWDTDKHGKPDLADLALRAVSETGAEAVICISNPRLTWNVVETVERNGIPGYGAIWDS
jgi:NAD(P)H-flavin reductase